MSCLVGSLAGVSGPPAAAASVSGAVSRGESGRGVVEATLAISSLVRLYAVGRLLRDANAAAAGHAARSPARNRAAADSHALRGASPPAGTQV